MIKSTDTSRVDPALRILPVLSVEGIESEAAKLALKQNLALPVFASLQIAKNDVTTASLSAAATLIDNALKHAEADGTSVRFEAKNAITRAPTSPIVIAQDLKNAVSKSGLFYESHLNDYTDGLRTLAEIKQEPQNQPNSTPNHLLLQQLNILENQRLAWHGEVWSGQKMDWDIYSKNEHDATSGDNYQGVENQDVIASDLTLHLPYLGKVTAKLILQDGRMRIRLVADETETLSALKAQSKDLADAIEKNGQILEELKVTSYV